MEIGSKKRASLQSDDETRWRLRELASLWQVSMSMALRRLVTEALIRERDRESRSIGE